MEQRAYIGKSISILYRLGHSFCNHKFQHFGIGSGHFAFLLVLFSQDGISQESLSKELDIDKTTTTRALAKLEEQGYIIRRSHPHDKRVHQIFLTAKAHEIAPAIRQTLTEWASLVTMGLSMEETDKAQHLLERMAANATLSRIRGEV